MKRILLSLALIAGAGAASAATASHDTTPARAAYVSGRNVVWTSPKTETPYALQGPESPAKTETPRLEIQPHGRSGTSFDWSAKSSR